MSIEITASDLSTADIAIRIGNHVVHVTKAQAKEILEQLPAHLAPIPAEVATAIEDCYETVSPVAPQPQRPEELSEGSWSVLTALVRDAGNWSGMPLFGEQAECRGEAAKGHLTDLKKKGYVITDTDQEDPSLSWVYFGDKSKALFPSEHLL